MHIDKAGASAKFWVERVALARNVGFTARELNELHSLVREKQADLMEAWYVHFRRDR